MGLIEEYNSKYNHKEARRLLEEDKALYEKWKSKKASNTVLKENKNPSKNRKNTPSPL